MEYMCMPWCMYTGQRTTLLFSLPCLHGEHACKCSPLNPHFALSFKKKGPTDHPGEHLESLVQLQPHASVQPPRGPTPALHAYTTAHTSPCYSEASTGQGSSPHLSYKGVLLLAGTCFRGPAHTRLSCAVFLSCFVSLLVCSHGAWAE